MYYYFLISYARGKYVPIENSTQILPDLALLWFNNVKSTALPVNLWKCACQATPQTAYWWFGWFYDSRVLNRKKGRKPLL